MTWKEAIDHVEQKNLVTIGIGVCMILYAVAWMTFIKFGDYVGAGTIGTLASIVIGIGHKWGS